jgi:anti-sigma B factor antagonist
MSEMQPTSPDRRRPSGSRRRLEVGVDHVGPGQVVVVVSGELDVTTAGTLRAALTALLNRGGLDTISLDLRQVDLLDPAAVGTLVAARRICQEVNVQLRVTAASPIGGRLVDAADVDVMRRRFSGRRRG